MEKIEKNVPRKKILVWGAALLASLSVFPILSVRKLVDKDSESDEETIKMLTQDGKLVEINKKLLMSTGNKISNDELQTWIKK